MVAEWLCDAWTHLLLYALPFKFLFVFRLEHARQWLGAQWAGLSRGSAEPARAARRALRRHRSRAGALPGGHFDHAAGPRPRALARAARRTAPTPCSPHPPLTAAPARPCAAC
eukprot:scaffold18286_cov49-Phaeocystis_antarctica.AAC.3